MNRTFSAPKQWGKDATHDETYAHFGYEVKHESGAGTGCWPNDGKTIMQNLRALPEVLEQFSDPKKRIRVVFDYDPDFPRALFQVWGMETVTMDEFSTAGPKTISVINASSSICLYAASLLAGSRLRKSTTYRFATKAPPFSEILTHIAGEGQGAERSI